MDPKPTAVVYVDGFNLYRRSLQRRNGLKWLDLYKLSQLLLPDFNVLAVEYFTAQVKPHVSRDARSSLRQQVYLRALDTVPQVRVHLGKFSVDTRIMPVAPFEIDEATGTPKTAKVLKVEEKRSDVNMAARMVADALTSRCNVHVALTNDSDHAGQIEMLIEEFGKSVGLLVPFLDAKRSAKELRSLPLEFVRPIHIEHLQASQLDPVLTDSRGTIKVPSEWL